MLKEYAPQKTLYKRWSGMRVFARMMAGLAAKSAEQTTVMIDATYLKAHRAASGLRAKNGGAGA